MTSYHNNSILKHYGLNLASQVYKNPNLPNGFNKRGVNISLIYNSLFSGLMPAVYLSLPSPPLSGKVLYPHLLSCPLPLALTHACLRLPSLSLSLCSGIPFLSPLAMNLEWQHS